MMLYQRVSIILIFIVVHCCFNIVVSGQNNFSFNFDVENRFPSNRIYDVITDRHGYLWIATEKGVVRYNGYDFKIFNESTGLPTDDIWSITEDKSGKIWLCSISDEFGYLFNNKYYKATIYGFKGPHPTIYPQWLQRSGDNIVFMSSFLHGDGRLSACIERNDTIFNISEKAFDQSVDSNKTVLLLPKLTLADDSGHAFFHFNNYIYKISLKGNTIESKKIFAPDSLSKAMMSNDKAKSLGPSVITYDDNNKLLYCKNIFTGALKKIDLTQCGIQGDICYSQIDPQNNIYNLISANTILQFKYDSEISHAGIFIIKNIIKDKNVDGSKIKTTLHNDFWGTCICTINNGLWISNNVKNNFIREDNVDIRGYRFTGVINDSNCLLWNAEKHSLAMLNSSLQIKYSNYRDIVNLRRVMPYNGDTLLFLGPQSYYYIGNGSNRIYIINNLSSVGDVYSTIADNQNRTYFIGHNGFFCSNIRNGNQGLRLLDHDRYIGLFFDSTRQSYWAYNNYKVFIHERNKDTIISSDQFSNFGVGKITKIAIDNKYGNIFFNGSNGATMYDPDNNTYQELFKNINLKGSYVFTYNGLIIEAGQFGVLFSKILGKRQISGTKIYPNLKNENYNYIYDCDVAFGRVLLNTDKGAFDVVIPDDSEVLNSKTDSLLFNYKFILSYRDTPNNFKSGGTIILNQNFRRLQFDIIKPFGNGHPSYAYKYANDTAWQELNANEITLPSKFIPGNFYLLYLKVYDNVWRSDVIAIHIYIQPYWWQTISGRRGLWLLIVVCIVLLLTISVLVTRKIVLNLAKKRSLRMELELKAIYAQINPHFIFNSLTSALLLVEKNEMAEAYAHISTFSRLLRSYLKSSRNKLITLAEETENLRDYLELQQTRFKNKFEFEISMTDIPEPKKIMIPSLLIQPFVENAVNHGILPKKTTGHLKIVFSMASTKNEIFCIIEDDGIGRKQSRLLNDGRKDKSYGDLLIKELVNIFNKYEQMNIEIDYTDKDDITSGTIVTIRIKNINYAK